MRSVSVATAVALSIQLSAAVASAVPQPADGYLYTRQTLPELTEGCVAHAKGGDFVGVGPALSFPTPSGGTRSILFVSSSGEVRTVATGLNSIGDCVYDAASDVLYVTDSGANFSGATTGDTVFAIPGDSTSVPVDGLEVLPSGTIANAFSIDLFGDGLLVSNANGGGAGTVVHIDLSGATPVASTFANGFDYTGGLIVRGSDVLISEATGSFASAIYSYSDAGARQSTLSGPTYDHGSIDIAVAADGAVLATGSPTLAAVAPGGTVTPLVTGVDGGTGFDAFGGGVSVNAFTGRIDFLASSFSGADDDRSVHRLIPIDRLVLGGGSTETDCMLELYGIEVTISDDGTPTRSAICTDGDACDADGAADGTCTFPLGLCLNVGDARTGDCAPPSPIATIEHRTRFESVELDELVAKASALLPTSDTSCVMGDGVRVPLRTLANGKPQKGKANIRFRATTDSASSVRDSDGIRLVCEPSAASGPARGGH